jgi:hypothetical protein
MESSASDQLADIVSPAMPPASGFAELLLVIMAAALFATVAVAVWRWHCSAKRARLRQLKRLRNACLRKHVSPRMTSYWIAALLKQRLGVRHLSASVALPESLLTRQAQWDEFLRRLHQARYAPHACNVHDVEALIAETRFWLRRWP